MEWFVQASILFVLHFLSRELTLKDLGVLLKAKADPAWKKSRYKNFALPAL